MVGARELNPTKQIFPGGIDMKGSFGLVVAVIISLLAVVIIEQPVTSSATTAGSDTVSVTSDGNGAGNASITSAHWYNTNKSVTASCATDANPTVGALDADQLGVSLSGLTASTTQNCTIGYLKQQSDATVGIVLAIIPFLLLMGGLVSAFGASYMGVKAGLGSGLGGNIENLVVIMVGVILVPVVLSFVTLASDAYSPAPSFIGVNAILPLVSIGYILSLMSTAFGGFAPKVRGVFGGN